MVSQNSTLPRGPGSSDSGSSNDASISNDASGNSPSSGGSDPGTSDAGGSDSSSKNQQQQLPKKYFCKICNQGFTRKHNMVSHELIHNSIKPHVCTVCHLKFRRIHDLKRHKILHTGERPYTCDKCNRSFARPDALLRHHTSPNACTGNKDGLPDDSQHDGANSVSLSSMSAGSGGPSMSIINSSTSASPLTQTSSEHDNYSMDRWKKSDSQPGTKALFDRLPINPVHGGEQQTGNFTNYLPPPLNSTMQNQTSQTQTPSASMYSYQLPPALHVSHPLHNTLPPAESLQKQKLPFDSNNSPLMNPQYVSMRKYQDLVTYTHSLQKSLVRMNERITSLEGNTSDRPDQRLSETDGDIDVDGSTDTIVNINNKKRKNI